MSFRPIILPEPPPVAGFAGVPEIFDKGVTSVVRRAVVISNGVSGAENQCRGLIRALGLGSTFEVQQVLRPRGGIHNYLRWLPLALHQQIFSAATHLPTWEAIKNSIFSLLTFSLHSQPPRIGWSRKYSEGTQSSEWKGGAADAHRISDASNQGIVGEGPVLVVASGRDTVKTAMEVKKLAPDSTFVIQIQHPHCDISEFDMVVTPAHDFYGYTPQAKLEVHEKLLRWIRPPPPANNVVLTVGALHHADSVALRSAAANWHHHLAHLPRPIIAVNIGGPHKYCKYGHELSQQLVTALKQVLVLNGGCARITFSRRTPPSMREFIEREFEEHERVNIWNGQGENPHLGHLAWGDAFVVTADSVSMLSEACSTGKPVYAVGADQCKWKFKEFITTLRKRGALRTLTGFENMSESWSYPPLRDNEEVASKVRLALAAKGWSI